MYKKIFYFVFAVAVFGLIISFASKPKVSTVNPASPSPTSPNADSEGTTREQYSVTVSVDFGNGKIEKDKILLKKPSTAYDALIVLVQSKNLKINTKQYDFGVFVESIDGFESNKDKSWIYFINGKSGAIAADKQEVVGDDLVEWKYIAPAAE